MQLPDLSSPQTLDLNNEIEKMNTLGLHDEQESDTGEAEEDEDFSFVCVDPNGSPISADDAFLNGQIRAIYPVFDQHLLLDDSLQTGLRSPLRKVFVEKGELEGVPQGTYCEWVPQGATEESYSSSSTSSSSAAGHPDVVKKSNSTGFSKLWRFRDLVHRSSSDGKDAFVFLNNEKENNNNISRSGSREKKKKEEKEWSLGEQYAKNRAKREEGKRRSYLPYRVGFFTTVNGFTKNVHPF